VLTTEAFKQLRVTVTAGERIVLNEPGIFGRDSPGPKQSSFRRYDAPSVLLRVLPPMSLTIEELYPNRAYI